MSVLQGELTAPVSGRIAIVTSRFNAEVTERLEKGAMDRLHEAGLGVAGLVQVRVPGAVEIPLAAKWLLQEGAAAVIALGAVIRGETSHYDYVCNSVERGCSLLQLEFSRPVVFGVLTTETEEQALARAGGDMGHKGREAAEVALEMLDLVRRIKNQPPTQKETNHV